jgi:DsbC/DsbD-like thiol-disulfide interchange protein
MYWKNPGDSGGPPEVEWVLPEGYTAGELRFPTPERHGDDDMVSFIYHDTLTLLSTITRETNAVTGPISAELEWVVCSNVCIGEKASVVAETVKADAALFADAKSKFPRDLTELGVTIENARAKENSGTVTVNLSLAGSAKDSILAFYPEDINDYMLDLLSIDCRNGEISFTAKRSEGDARIQRVKGILRTSTGSYQINSRVSGHYVN